MKYRSSAPLQRTLSPTSLLPAILFALSVATAAHAASTAEVTGFGTAALSVDDLLGDDAGVFTVPGFGADVFSVSTADGALAAVDYTFDWDGDKRYALAVDTRGSTGDALGTAFAGFAFTFETTTETAFAFSVTPGSPGTPDTTMSLPSDYRAEFAGIVAEARADHTALNGVAGNIPLDGAFFATGILPPGVYSLTIDLFQSYFRTTPTDGGALASVVLTATHAPLPTAGVMGMATLIAAGLAGTRRRRAS